jgi:tetratricopeptide (TPR) repeat protein
VVERADVFVKLADRFSILAAQHEMQRGLLGREEFVRWVEHLLLNPAEMQSIRTARVHRVSGWYEESIRYHSLVLQLQPAVSAYRDRALVRSIVGEMGDAIVDLTIAIRFASAGEKAHLYYQRGLLYMNLGDSESGAANLTWAIRCDQRYKAMLPLFGFSTTTDVQGPWNAV